jgi:hypothetical protein
LLEGARECGSWRFIESTSLLLYEELESRRSQNGKKEWGKIKLVYALFMTFLIASHIYAGDLQSDITW